MSMRSWSLFLHSGCRRILLSCNASIKQTISEWRDGSRTFRVTVKHRWNCHISNTNIRSKSKPVVQIQPTIEPCSGTEEVSQSYYKSHQALYFKHASKCWEGSTLSWWQKAVKEPTSSSARCDGSTVMFEVQSAGCVKDRVHKDVRLTLLQHVQDFLRGRWKRGAEFYLLTHTVELMMTNNGQHSPFYTSLVWLSAGWLSDTLPPDPSAPEPLPPPHTTWRSEGGGWGGVGSETTARKLSRCVCVCVYTSSEQCSCSWGSSL